MLIWLKIASRQGKSLQEAQAANTSSELPLWAAFFEWEMSERQAIHYYLAQISRDIRRLFSKHPKRIKLEHCLLNFKSRRDRSRDLRSTQEISMSFWLGVTGLGGRVKKGE